MDDICIQLHAQVLPPTEKDTDAQEYGAKWSIWSVGGGGGCGGAQCVQFVSTAISKVVT